MAFGLYCQVDAITNEATHMSYREQAAGDQPLSVMPGGYGPWIYDAVNRLAISNSAAAVTIALTRRQQDAASLIDQLSPNAQLFRSVASVLVNELNVLRDDYIGVVTTVWDPA